MQKKIIALAIASALTVPALAFADTSNVSVYGIADVSFDSVKNGSAGTNGGTTDSKVSSNSSRLGLKGAEDLGGGLKAIWQIETQIGFDGTAATGDTANNTLASRNTFAGLAGDSWGSVTMGRNDTPYKSSTRGLDVFMDHIADNRTLMGKGTTGFDQRFNNTVRYDSANMSGFKVALSYSASAEGNINSAADTKGKAVSLSGTYETGPYNAAFAYQKNTFGTCAAAASAAAPLNCAASANSLAAVAGSLTDEKAWKIAGSYKVSQFAVNAVYEKTTDSLGSAAGGQGHRAYYLAGVFNATANDAIKASYTKAKQLQDGNLVNSGAKQWALGYDHSMSKRTTVYAMYTRLDNDSAKNYALSSAAVATGATAAAGLGADPSAFSFGMKHSF